MPVPWLNGKGAEGDVAVASRAELVRNFSFVPFPETADNDQRERVRTLIRQASQNGLDAGRGGWFAVEGLDIEICRQLAERWLTEPDLPADAAGKDVWLSGNGEAAVLVNHREHLSIRACKAGFDLSGAVARAEQWLVALNLSTMIAFVPELGYITSCPKRQGSGLSLSVILHLPGLLLRDRTEALPRAAKQMRIQIGGAFGGGERVGGGFFEFAWQANGERQGAILVAAAEKVIRQLIDSERRARRELRFNDRERLLDYVGRAYGILRYAARLRESEMIGLVSGLRLGCRLGLLPRLSATEVEGWPVLLRDRHLQAQPEDASSPTRNGCERRALLIKRHLRQAEPGGVEPSQRQWQEQV